MSEKDGSLFLDFTENLNQNIISHINGDVIATKNKKPLKLIYWETYINKKDAEMRKNYLISNPKMYLADRLKYYFDEGVLKELKN